MKAVIYARFSSDRQSEASIDAQVRACTEYADSHHLNILQIYKDEAISGTTANRASYQEMLADAFEGSFDVILIHKYDRIARNLEEQVSLQKRLKQLNIRLIAVAQDFGEGKDAELTKGIQWVLGEYYSANLAEETKKGHKETALKGLHNGGYPPFGYDIKDQKYLINEKESYWVRRMFDTCLSGGKYTDLIEEMEAAGIVGKRGKPIKYTQIYEILQNEKYTGTYVYSPDEEQDRNLRRTKPNAIRIEGAIPAIISTEEYLSVQAITASRKRAGRHTNRLSGLVYCSCGAKMHIYGHNRFICSKHCGAKGISLKSVEEAVDTYLSEVLSEKNIRAVETVISNYRLGSIERKKTFEKDRKEKISLKQKELDGLFKALASGEFKDSYSVLDKKISSLQKELETLETSKFTDPADKKISGWLSNLKDSDKAPKTLIDRIEISSGEITIYSVFGNTGCGGTHAILPNINLGKKI